MPSFFWCLEHKLKEDGLSIHTYVIDGSFPHTLLSLEYKYLETQIYANFLSYGCKTVFSKKSKLDDFGSKKHYLVHCFRTQFTVAIKKQRVPYYYTN